jgi:hypothetical protein
MAETASTTWWESKLVRRLDVVAGVAAIVVVCRVAFAEDISWLAWALAGAPVVLLATTRWPFGAILLLVGASAMPRFFVEFLGWNARPEHFAGAIVALGVVVGLIRRKPTSQLDKLDYWVLAYVAINYISSAFGSSAPSTTLRWALQNNLAVLPYFLIRFLVPDRETLGKAFRILLGVGIVESVYGILCYASHNVLGTTGGVEVGAYLRDVAAPYGSMFEPNLFGAYTASCAVTFLSLYLHEGPHGFGSLVGFLIASLATTLSFSRAALFALVIAICWVFWRTRHLRHGRRNRLSVFVLGSGLIFLVAATAVGGVLQERASNLYYQGLLEGTTISRFIIIQQALQEVPQHPFLGSGTASFNLSFDWARYIPEWASDKTWIGNAPVRILHDTGLLGLTAVLGFVVSAWRKIRLGLRGENSPVPMLLGLSAGVLLYGVSFQSTDGTTLAFFWVQLGFLASAAILISDRSQPLKGLGGVSSRGTHTAES